MSITLADLQKKGDIKTISLADLQKKGNVSIVSQPKQQPQAQQPAQLPEQIQKPDSGNFVNRFLKASRQARQEGIDIMNRGTEQRILGDTKREKATGFLKEVQGTVKGTAGAPIAGLVAVAEPLIKWITGGGEKLGEDFKSGLSAIIPDFIENPLKEKALKEITKAVEGGKFLSDKLEPETKELIGQSGLTAVQLLDFIPYVESFAIGKAVASTTETVVKATPKVVEAVSESMTKLRTALKASKTPKKDILASLDEGVIKTFEAEQLAAEYGIELPASSFASPAKAKSEQILAEGFFGGKLKARATKAVDDFTKVVDDIQAKAATSGELGEEILTKFKSVETERKAVIKQLYDDVAEIETRLPINEKIVIETTNAQKLITELIDRKKTALKTGVGSPTEIKQLKAMQKGLKNNKDLKTMRAALQEVGDLANFDSFVPTTNEKLFRKLYGSLKKDIDSAITAQVPELGEALTSANKAFSEFETLKQRPFVKSIQKLGKAGDVDTIADRLTKTKVSTNEIEQIYSTLGAETTEQIQRKIISDILESAKSPNVGFKPAGFSKQLKSIGDERLSALLEPEQIKQLKNLDKINQLIAKGTAVSKGSQTALIQQVVRILSAPATGGTSVLGEWIMARVFNSKKGQLWLKGLNKKTVEALKKAKVKSKIDATNIVK